MTISIQYNPSNYMLQKSINSSTDSINNSLTRLSSGFKINAAKDDSAGLYISTNLNTNIRGLVVVSNNAQNAMSYLNTASSALSGMTATLNRMRDLAVTAASETYDDSSRTAIQSEADKLAEQLANTKSSTEFNGIKIFENEDTSGVAGTTGNVGTTDNVGTTGNVGTYAVKKLTESEAIAQGYTVIKTEDDLKAMADNLSGKYILMNDITLTSNWTPIGSYANNGNFYNAFRGQFNGNGCTISNVNVDTTSDTTHATGFFACIYGSSAKVENVNLKNVDIKGGGSYTGGLVGLIRNDSRISNCSVSGDVSGKSSTGGLAGENSYSATITSSYATGSVSGNNNTGGLIGGNSSTVTDCYATGKVTGTGNGTGGLVGYNNFYAVVKNCYATGSVTSTNRYTGGLVGNHNGESVTNSYATGSVSGTSSTGGLVGQNAKIIANCYATGKVTGSGDYTGGLVGWNYGSTITNSYTLGNVSGTSFVGGLVGQNEATVTNCYCMGNAVSTTSASSVGGFVGCARSSSATVACFYNTDNATAANAVGSVKGTCSNDITGLKTGDFSDAEIFEDAGWDEKDWYFTGKDSPKCSWQKKVENIKEFQIGVDEKKNSVMTIATGLDISSFKVDLTSREGALGSIDKIDEMLKKVLKESTEIGASQNKLDSIMSSQEVRSRSLIAAKSTIKDADIAEESSKYVNSQIRQQCSTALMSQLRNSDPSLIMQLINATKF